MGSKVSRRITINFKAMRVASSHTSAVVSGILFAIKEGKLVNGVNVCWGGRIWSYVSGKCKAREKPVFSTYVVISVLQGIVAKSPLSRGEVRAKHRGSGSKSDNIERTGKARPDVIRSLNRAIVRKLVVSLIAPRWDRIPRIWSK